MGVELLTEDQYRDLQTLGEFDTKTSSWVHTPADIRALGGAVFCDRRYDTVFLYHNGANSYYAGRGFRGSLASSVCVYTGRLSWRASSSATLQQQITPRVISRHSFACERRT